MARTCTRVDRVKEGDVDRIVGIVRSLPEWFTPSAVTEVSEAARQLPGFAVRVEGILRGFVLLDERECCIEIAWLAVEREFHGEGLGTLLLEAAETYACSRDKPVLTVKTYGGMDYEPYLETLAFYRKKGFRLYEVIEDYKPFGGQPAAILVKNLNCNHYNTGPQRRASRARNGHPAMYKC